MKRLIAIYLILIGLPLFIFSQDVSNVDFISPFHEGVAAIKKGDTWGFINTEGDLIIDFRNDLVIEYSEDIDYPYFNSGRCLIKEQKDGITYFGYIDSSGHEVLEPQFLNATAFNDGLAIILKLYKNILGRNDVLDKAMINYDYMELAIDPDGEIVHYISEKPVHITLSKFFMKGPPPIRSKFLSKSLIAIRDDNNKWRIKKV
ncbi:WG repeat-containing protein [Winogradskyella sp. DF17]|uniref:WG repeat-containing protein n=1 Tax=Winogradskyella pelagia TaxID=2819984 RepID=A0ABS3T2K6_9FLAO|nr:WG repeat-containing protein [Winogradskyella sp. DF17]MBO3115960.1 WG repeat-containing protein [Winogradskyella sp. DF17]